MAEISGENGAVYWNEGLTNTALVNTITFDDGTTGATDDQTITSSSAGDSTGPFIDFQTTGYTSGMLVTISGCSSAGADNLTANNRTFTINTVSSGVLTVDEAVTTGIDTTGVLVFLEEDPGVEVVGFYNWTLSYAGDVLDTTNFDTTGGREYIAGLTNWTVTADKYFLTADTTVDEWVGETCEMRLFINYVAETSGAPSSGNISQYWDGDTVVTGFDETTPRDALITQSVSFQGDGALELKTQTDPWSCGIST